MFKNLITDIWENSKLKKIIKILQANEKQKIFAKCPQKV